MLRECLTGMIPVMRGSCGTVRHILPSVTQDGIEPHGV